MIAKLLPLLFLLLGLVAGGAAAVLTRDPGAHAATPPPAGEAGEAPPHGAGGGAASGPSGAPAAGDKVPPGGPAAAEYVRLGKQFVVPVVRGSEIRALIILTISIEARPGHREEIFAREPKLRDSLLEVLFDHANAGEFAARFTDTTALQALKAELTTVARRDVGPFVTAVLIEDIMRQDN